MQVSYSIYKETSATRENNANFTVPTVFFLNSFVSLFFFSLLVNVLHVRKSTKTARMHTNKKNVCLLKAEKLLIEKLTLIIGGFYQAQ